MTLKVSDDTKIALIGRDITYIVKDIAEIKAEIKAGNANALPRMEFETFKSTDFANIKRLVYGAVGLLLTVFGVAIVNFFLKK